MKIIAFTGLMGSGKSTAVTELRELAQNRGLSTHNLKFAQPLYDIQNFIYERISQAHVPLDHVTKDRRLLQWLGTEWGREQISETLWIDLWSNEVERLSAIGVDIITCDDLRFENEAQAIKELGGILIKLTSSHSEKRIDTKSGIAKHASEAGVSNESIDYVIENNGTIDDLRSSLLTINSRHGIW